MITIKWCNHKINKQVHIDRQRKCSCIIEAGKNLIVWQWIYRFRFFSKRSSWKKKKAYLYKYQLPAFGKSRKLFVFGCISLVAIKEKKMLFTDCLTAWMCPVSITTGIHIMNTWLLFPLASLWLHNLS